MIAIMQDRRIPFAIRCHTMLRKVNAMQEALDEGRWEACLLDAKAAEDAKEGVRAFASLEDMHVLFRNLYALEPLSYMWRERLLAAEHLLYETDQETYTHLQQEFETSQPDLFVKMEQIVVYFIFAYFCGAVYDEYVYALAQEAVVNAYLIRELWLAKWLEQDKTITIKEYGRDRLPLFQGIGTLRRKSGMYGRNDGWANFSIDVCVVEVQKKKGDTMEKNSNLHYVLTSHVAERGSDGQYYCRALQTVMVGAYCYCTSWSAFWRIFSVRQYGGGTGVLVL